MEILLIVKFLLSMIFIIYVAKIVSGALDMIIVILKHCKSVETKLDRIEQQLKQIPKLDRIEHKGE